MFHVVFGFIRFSFFFFANTTRAHACPISLLLYNLQMVAEFIGTFIIVFGGAATPIVDAKYPNVETLIGKATSSGIAVAVVIFSTGHISGAHLNPAVTIAFSLFKNFPFACVPFYIVSQVMGSICASTALSFIFEPLQNGGVTVPTISTSRAFILEFVITFILLFVVTSVTFDPEAVSVNKL
jgi:aquaporin NIP